MKMKNTVPMHKLFICGRARRKQNLVHMLWAGIETHHGGRQESLLAQPHNVREKLPEEGSGLGNRAPATLLVLNEQIMNGPTPAKGVEVWGGWEIGAHHSFLTFFLSEPPTSEQDGEFACFHCLER